MNKKSEILMIEDRPIAEIPQTQEGQMINMIERLALNPDVDVEKLERMVALQMTMLDRQSEQQYTQAMVRVQQNLRGVTRDKHNPQTHSNYPSLEAMKKAVVPAYTAEGFAMSYGEGESPKPEHVRVICKVMHSGGHSENFFYDCPIDDKGIQGKTNKTATHGKASAVSYGERYILKLIFNVTIQDEDDDGNAAGQPVERITEEQALTIHARLTDNDIDVDKFESKLERIYGCRCIDDISAGLYSQIDSDITTIIKNRAAKV